MINKVEIANLNTSKLPKLNAEKNKELFIRMRNGDNEAREELITRKLKISFKYNTKIWRSWRKSR